ncbi:hypothetical protein, partial [Robinsoniella peoriensis]|uniref:hypothetical protein n=1 Tax=Robinsoniella peoriensis TaxID=180332 RepID=UPI001A9B4E6E
PPPIPVSHTHLSEIAFVDTKLVFSAGWRPWAVAGRSFLDVAICVSAVLCEMDVTGVLFGGYYSTSTALQNAVLLPSDCKRAVSVPPKSAPGRLENASLLFTVVPVTLYSITIRTLMSITFITKISS